MSTALKVYEPNSFAALDPTSRAAIALKANIGNEGFSESDLIRVKTPSGGGIFWTIDGPSGPQQAAEIEGILVFQSLCGILWPSLEPSDDSKPIAETKDMVTGVVRAKITRGEDGVITAIEGASPEMTSEISKLEIGQTGTFQWTDLSYTQFGTGKNETGKFAKEGRALFILRAGSVLPLMIRTGPSALKNFKKLLTQLEYPYWQCVLSLGLKEQKSQGGQKYSEIVPRLVGTISDEAALQIEKEYKLKLQKGWNSGAIQAGEEAAE